MPNICSIVAGKTTRPKRHSVLANTISQIDNHLSLLKHHLVKKIFLTGFSIKKPKQMYNNKNLFIWSTYVFC